MNNTSLCRFLQTALAAAALSAHVPVHAQGQTSATPGANTGEMHRLPPPEAIAACKALKMEQACSFTSPRGTMSGTCWQPDASKPLACRPAQAAQTGTGEQQGESRRPPAESLAACNGHKLNDACAFTSPKGAETGSCFQPDASKPLACRPARKP